MARNDSSFSWWIDMAAQRVDTRGLSCPEPVLAARKAMLAPGAQRVEVLVDNEVSVENIQRMAQAEGWRVIVDAIAEGTLLQLTRGESTPAAAVVAEKTPAVSSSLAPVVLIGSDLLGSGDETLGRILMRSFIKTLVEVEHRPRQIIFINSAVRLTTAGSTLLDALRQLEAAGVELISCVTCLDFFHLLDSLAVGRKSNMFEIASSLLSAERVVRV